MGYGLYIMPEHRGAREIGGNPTQSAVYSGHDPMQESSVKHFWNGVERAMSAPHELDFRRAVGDLLTGFSGESRRFLLREAVSIYREAHEIPGLVLKSSRGGGYYRKIPAKEEGGRPQYVYSQAAYEKRPDAHTDGEEARRGLVKQKLELRLRDRDHGIPVQSLHDLVSSHGAHRVAHAIKQLGAKHHHGRLYMKSEVSQAARKAGFHDPGDPRALPAGTRRTWNRRVVEKRPDGTWHVVGEVHTGGTTHPELDTSKVSHSHLTALLHQMVRLKDISERASSSEKKD